MGYTVEPTVEIPGTISRRGGIVDIFPVAMDRPVRIEFFDDEVESIRHFDPGTQRSKKRRIKSFCVTPGLETLPQLADTETLKRPLLQRTLP